MRATVMCSAVVLAAVCATAHAQAPDMDRAKILYSQANAEMNSGQFAEAARDYGAAYDITKDAVLFFKIATANEKAGRCDVALIYFGRYLKEAHPEPKFAEITQERIRVCGGKVGTWSTQGSGAQGAPDRASGLGPRASGDQKPVEAPVQVAEPTLQPAVGSPQPAAAPQSGASSTAAWLLAGGSLAFVTAGVVLAYSASSSEQDVKDLYAGTNGIVPTYDAATASRYHDLIDEGHRYEYLSWTSFAIAAGCAAGAAILFVRGNHDEETLSVAPVIAPHQSGVAATLRF